MRMSTMLSFMARKRKYWPQLSGSDRRARYCTPVSLSTRAVSSEASQKLVTTSAGIFM